MSKLFLHVNHLTAFTSLHTISHYLPLSEFCGQISENISPSHLTREKFFLLGLLFVFRFFFLFSYFGLLRPQLQIFKVWLTQIQQNVLTKSP